MRLQSCKGHSWQSVCTETLYDICSVIKNSTPKHNIEYTDERMKYNCIKLPALWNLLHDMHMEISPGVQSAWQWWSTQLDPTPLIQSNCQVQLYIATINKNQTAHTKILKSKSSIKRTRKPQKLFDSNHWSQTLVASVKSSVPTG
jgi:hypothetical protein